MLKIGDYNSLEIVKHLDFGMYLRSGEEEILLPTKYIPDEVKIGDYINVFIYKDSEDRLIATTLTPKAKVGDFACLKVKEVIEIGAFLDWGLEKDLFVPQSEQHKSMMEGQEYIVMVCLDSRTDRIIGVSKLSAFLSKDTADLVPGEEVKLLIYEMTDLGFMAIINKKFRGILYKNEVFTVLKTGSEVTGYIKKVREDGKIDLTLKKFGYREITDAREIILEKLKDNNGILQLSDHSSPEEIKLTLRMSKKVFKKSIGSLYKEGLIELNASNIILRN